MFQKSDQNKFQFDLNPFSCVLKYNQSCKYAIKYVNKIFYYGFPLQELAKINFFEKFNKLKNTFRGLKVNNMNKIDHKINSVVK